MPQRYEIATQTTFTSGLYSVSTSPGPGGTAAGVRLSCDRHLLAAAHKNIGVGPVLATLKAILSMNIIYTLIQPNIPPNTIIHIITEIEHLLFDQYCK